MERFTHAGLSFEVTDSGDVSSPPVILLHGFPADRHSWDAVSHRLVAGAYRVLAPEQRGYSPGARPSSRRDYRVDLLGEDVLALADAAGAPRFHLVGHDWGAAVAWYLAGAYPERVASLTALSVPHPAAMGQAVRRGSQALHSWYMLAFQVPFLPELTLGAAGGRLLARALQSSGLEATTAARYAARGRSPNGWRGPLGWYRALPFELRAPARPVEVPTLMMWGPGDRFITRAAAEGAARWVRGDYRFVEVHAGDHWLPETAPDAVADAVAGWLGDHPA
jgi:pimeloyl-ACP methyl ester carboxylesterase